MLQLQLQMQKDGMQSPAELDDSPAGAIPVIPIMYAMVAKLEATLEHRPNRLLNSCLYPRASSRACPLSSAIPSGSSVLLSLGLTLFKDLLCW